MNLNIGKTIRALRIERHYTQDKLASILGVTPQAVSRWENGTGYPDITLLPKLAGTLGSTTDTLLGVDLCERDARLEAIICEIEHQAEGKPDHGTIERAREYASEFPSDKRIMRHLADTLFRLYLCGEGADSAAFCEAERTYRILADTSDEGNERAVILERLAMLYAEKLRREEGEGCDSTKLERVLMRIPDMEHCREEIAARANLKLGDGSSSVVCMLDSIEKLTEALLRRLRETSLQSLPDTPEMLSRKNEIIGRIYEAYGLVFGRI